MDELTKIDGAVRELGIALYNLGHSAACGHGETPESDAKFEAIIAELERRISENKPKLEPDQIMLADGRVKKVQGELPETADGVVVGHGPRASVYGPSPIEGDNRIIEYDWFPPPVASDGNRFCIGLERTYTSREAAEAAQAARAEGS